VRIQTSIKHLVSAMGWGTLFKLAQIIFSLTCQMYEEDILLRHPV